MKTRMSYMQWIAAIVLGAVLAISGRSSLQAGPELREEVNDETGVEALTRGPVHEAFAEAISFEPEAGMIAPRMPPEVIEELPPAQRPAGDNVTWIPGYWAWDDDREDFLWISGIWRAVPPGRQWIPGYWSEIPQGAQWISGYWADAADREMQYLPEPPASLEGGPNVEGQDNQTWIPGTWEWYENRYAWRPGYWMEADPNWIWVPAHYVWTPLGYVFVSGYWDYAINERGLLFAPVYFSNGVYLQQGFTYTPWNVINPAVFATHLFVRPDYCHYYFGDYYGPNYLQSGVYPWFAYNRSHHGYDPIYAHQHWEHRHDRGWSDQVHSRYEHWRDHAESRPPRTWADQRDIGRGQINHRDHGIVMAAPLNELAASKTSPLKVHTVDKSERNRLAKETQNYQQFRTNRLDREMRASERPEVNPLQRGGALRRELPRSPIGQTVQRPGKGLEPPKLPETPKLDHLVKPNPRTSGRPSDVRDDPRKGTTHGRVGEQPRSRQLDPRDLPDIAPKNLPNRRTEPAPRANPPTRSRPTQPTPHETLKPAPKLEPMPKVPPGRTRIPQLEGAPGNPQAVPQQRIPRAQIPAPQTPAIPRTTPPPRTAPAQSVPQSPLPRVNPPQGGRGGAHLQPPGLNGPSAPRANIAPRGGPTVPHTPQAAPSPRISPPTPAQPPRVTPSAPRAAPVVPRVNPPSAPPQPPRAAPPVPRVNPPSAPAQPPRAAPAVPRANPALQPAPGGGPKRGPRPPGAG